MRTVGEKIGKTHLTYAQGASAELVAMGPSARGHVRPARLDDSCALLRCRRNNGREPVRIAVGDHPQSPYGMDIYSAHGHIAIGQPLLVIHASVLSLPLHD